MNILKFILVVALTALSATVNAAPVAVRGDTHKITESGSMWTDYQYGRPGVYSEYFEHFFTNPLSDNDLFISRDSNGGGFNAGLADEVGGVYLLTNGTADNGYTNIQLKSESFIPTSNKTIFCEGRIKVSDATQSDVFFGLSVTDNDIDADGTTNGIYFRKDDGDTNWDFATMASSSKSEETGIATADTSYIKLGFKVNGTSSIDYWVNDSQQGSFDTNIPATEMAPSIQIQNGEASSKTLKIDSILCAQQL